MARRNQAEIELTARDRTKSAFRAVNQNLGRFASIGLAGAVAGVALLTRASLQQIDALAKQSQLLGITTEKLAALQLITAKTGVEQKTLEKALINVTRVVAEAATGTGLAVDSIKALGLEAKSLSQQSPDEQFKLIAKAMEGVNDQSQKVLIAYELFGGRGAALLRTLEATAGGFEEAEEKTRRFGTAISAVDAKGVEDANDAFTDMRESVKGLGFDLARRFAPGMEAASISTANFVVTIRRDVIPAFALLLEQLDLVVSNVRGLSDIELDVRIEVGADAIADAEKALDDFLASSLAKKLDAERSENEALNRLSGRAQAERILMEREAELTAAQSRLEDVKAEQERRAEIILAAEQKLAETRAAQQEEARLAAREIERDADREKFEEQLELEGEFIDERITLAKRAAKEFERIAKAEANANQRAAVAEIKLVQRSAQQTIRLRQATAQTSVAILQTLVGKNKTAARALFLVEKGLAIARVIQNTAAGSVKAFADLPYPAAVAAAASITAFGAAQVGLIAATALTGVGAIGGGGTPGAIGTLGIEGGGDFGGGGFAANDQQFGGGGTPAVDQGVVQLIFPNLFGITQDAIDALADALREASENRDVIIVSGQGRNAELLAGANG